LLLLLFVPPYFSRFVVLTTGSIIKATPAQQTAIIKLVGRVLSAKYTNPTVDISILQREIDQLVYALYGLTKEEIAIVEGRTNP